MFPVNRACQTLNADTDFPSLPVIKMGLFDQIPQPKAEVYCKNRQTWETYLEGTHQIQGAA